MLGYISCRWWQDRYASSRLHSLPWFYLHSAVVDPGVNIVDPKEVVAKDIYGAAALHFWQRESNDKLYVSGSRGISRLWPGDLAILICGSDRRGAIRANGGLGALFTMKVEGREGI